MKNMCCPGCQPSAQKTGLCVSWGIQTTLARASQRSTYTLAYLENEKYVLSRMPAVGTKNRVMCFMGNTNDISQGIPAEYIVENLTNMCQFYKRLGMKIVGSTTLPKGDSYPLDQETDELNDLIRANWAAIGYDVLVDSASMV